MDSNEQKNEQKVWITISRTINTGSFNNVKVEAGYTKSYTEKENPEKIISDGVENLLKAIDKKTKKLRLKAKLAIKT